MDKNYPALFKQSNCIFSAIWLFYLLSYAKVAVNRYYHMVFFISDPSSALGYDISDRFLLASSPTYDLLNHTRKHFRKLMNYNVIPITESPEEGMIYSTTV